MVAGRNWSGIPVSVGAFAPPKISGAQVRCNSSTAPISRSVRKSLGPPSQTTVLTWYSLAEDLQRGCELDVRSTENPKIGAPDDGSAHALGHSLGGKDHDRRAGCPEDLPREVDHTPIADDDPQRLGRQTLRATALSQIIGLQSHAHSIFATVLAPASTASPVTEFRAASSYPPGS